MMKKSIFAVAVASVLTLGAAQAETVLYGSIRYDYQSKKIEDYSHTDTVGEGKFKREIKRITGKRVSNLADAGSRIGLKGSEDLGNGTAVIYNLEWGFNGMDGMDNGDGFKNRLAILGLTGDWGTFTAGRQNNPFKVTIVDDSVTDDFNGSDVISSAAQRALTTTLNGTTVLGKRVNIVNKDGFVVGHVTEADGKQIENYFNEDHYNITNAKYGRVGKVVAYTTPDFAGFQANVALMMNDDMYGTVNNSKNVDLWTINARYAYDLGANGRILAKAGYIHGKTAKNTTLAGTNIINGKTEKVEFSAADNKNASKAWGLFLGYDQDAFGVTADYAKGNYTLSEVGVFKTESGTQISHVVNGDKVKSAGWDLGARYSFGPNYFSTVRIAYGENTVKQDGQKDKVKSWAVGFEQKLSTRTRAWVEYGAQETKFAAKDVEKKKDNVVSIGMRHDF